jgi:hypothetical protein
MGSPEAAWTGSWRAAACRQDASRRRPVGCLVAVGVGRPAYERRRATALPVGGTSAASRGVRGCMRVTRVLLVVLVVAVAAIALVDEDPADLCAGSLRCAAQRLPAPITLMAGRVAYRIARDGHVSRVSAPRSRYPRGAAWFPGTGAWYRIDHGRLVVGRGREPLWRSREEIASNRIGVIAAGPSAVAFQYDHRLYFARIGSAERPVARRELPLGWTIGGLYTYSYPRRELLLRGDTGAILHTVARRPLEYRFDAANRGLYFLRHGVLMGARGQRTWRLASLSSLGMSANTSLQPLDGLIELLDDHRLAVVRPAGSLFASTSVRNLDRISSFLAIAPSGGAIAFTGGTSPTRGADAENVYLLHAGAHAATTVHREPGSFGGCAHWANVEWRGSWLLYSSHDGNLAAFDTAGAHGAIELSGLARRLLSGREGFDALWSR